MENKFTKPIIVYDGDCMLCDRSVQFIKKHMKKNTYLFFSSISQNYQYVKHLYNVPDIENSTIIYINNNQILTKSTAILKIIQNLKGLWPLIGILGIIPRKIRDQIYANIAKKRTCGFQNSV